MSLRMPAAERREQLLSVALDVFAGEGYHQNYLRAHPTQPYIVWNDIPKVEGFKRLFPALWSEKAAA